MLKNATFPGITIFPKIKLNFNAILKHEDEVAFFYLINKVTNMKNKTLPSYFEIKHCAVVIIYTDNSSSSC